MRYIEFRNLIREELSKHPEGLTWKELREKNNLPYVRPCPEWTKRLEGEIGLKRSRKANSGNSLVWEVRSL